MPFSTFGREALQHSVDLPRILAVPVRVAIDKNGVRTALIRRSQGIAECTPNSARRRMPPKQLRARVTDRPRPPAYRGARDRTVLPQTRRRRPCRREESFSARPLRRDHPRQAGEVGFNCDFRPPWFQQRADPLPGVVRNFHDEPSAGHQHAGGVSDQRSKDRHTVAAAEQRKMRLVSDDLALEDALVDSGT